MGQFLAEYLDVLDAEGVSDYTELLHRAALLAHDPDIQPLLHERYRVVLVDEFQDSDPSQVRLLQGLIAPDATFIAVGDPDQSIYAFRGADSHAILNLPDTFRSLDGAPAPVVVLGHTRRFGPVLRAAATRVLRSSSLAPLSSSLVRAHRNPVCEPGPQGPGILDVLTFDSESAEAAHLADILRRAHLEHGVPWSQMAVIVRSASRSGPALQRALSAAGVPVEVAADEIPLAAEQVITPLLQALRYADNLDALHPALVGELLLSPLAGADPADLRRLGRTLRRAERQADPAVRPESSDQLICDLLRRLVLAPDEQLPVVDPRAEQALLGLRRLAAVLRAAQDVITSGGTAEEALWALWSATFRRTGSGHRRTADEHTFEGTGWPQRLEQNALRGGDAGRRADADLDAVLALFAAAHRVEQRFSGHRGVANFLDELTSQQIPADTLAERGLRGPAVRLLTAHRAKGLQWQLVVVASVQDGGWPDLRHRGSLLQADRLAAHGLAESVTAAELLAEERRLFYVACTRARSRLVVTAVKSPYDDGLQPSRFLAELVGDAGVVRHITGRPPRALSVPGLVARLRSVTLDSESDPQLRAAAARRLAVLATSVDVDGRPLVPAANPDRWWGVAELTTAPFPVRAEGEPLALSGSQLASLEDCSLQWFFQHEAHAERARTTALGFGSLIHALADAVARGDLPADIEVLSGHLDDVWGQLGFEAPWQSTAERLAAQAALARFVAWHSGRPDRHFVASELSFEVVVPIGREGIRLRGSFDRVEVDVAGSVHIVDLKTQRKKASAAELAAHPQLGVYQLALAHGALDGLPEEVRADAQLPAAGEAPTVGGAELVQLRFETKGLPAVQAQAALEPDSEGVTWIEAALTRAEMLVRAEQFHPTPGDACRYCPYTAVCPAVTQGVEVAL